MSDHNREKDSETLFLEELKKEFFEVMAKNLKSMDKLYQEENFEEITKIAHDIKGTSGVFGLDKGSEIAKKLQFISADKDSAGTKELIDVLTIYMRENGVDI